MPKGHKRSPVRVPTLRGRIWIEMNGRAALTEAGADLLEQIAICGSLSEAARRLRFNYRRAWMLLDAMNRCWPRPLVTTATGGHRGGGTRVTELGRLVLRTYRDLQLQLEYLLGEAVDQLAILTRSSSAGTAPPQLPKRTRAASPAPGRP